MTKQRVLITGVSSGLGKAMAKYFAAQDFEVLGISRSKPEDLPGVRWIPCDITKESDRISLKEELEKCGTLDILINNAGKGIYAAWTEMEEAALREVFELDFFAPVALTKTLLPLLKPGSAIINISSVAGRIWVPCMGGYCAAKAALSMFSNSLRPELERAGIRVLDVSPGQINTGFSSRSCGGRRPPDSPGAKGHTPEALAKAVYQAWRKGKKRITYPRTMAFAVFFVRTFLADFYDRVNRKLWKL